MKDKKLHSIKKTGFKTPQDYFESVDDSIFNKLKENTLSDIKNSGYNTPDAYFDSIEDRILNKLNDDVSLEKIKETGFKTPENYLENLEDTIFISLEEDKVTKVIPLFSRRNILYFSSIAAVIMIMLGVFYDKGANGIDSLDLEVVETYLEQQDLDTYDIASILTDEDFSQNDFGIINDNFSEESLEDYLMDNANLEDIIEQ